MTCHCGLCAHQLGRMSCINWRECLASIGENDLSAVDRELINWGECLASIGENDLSAVDRVLINWGEWFDRNQNTWSSIGEIDLVSCRRRHLHALEDVALLGLSTPSLRE